MHGRLDLHTGDHLLHTIEDSSGLRAAFKCLVQLTGPGPLVHRIKDSILVHAEQPQTALEVPGYHLLTITTGAVDHLRVDRTPGLDADPLPAAAASQGLIGLKRAFDGHRVTQRHSELITAQPRGGGDLGVTTQII